MHEVFAYVKNHNLDFEVPYDFTGDTPSYRPDYIVRVDDGGPEPLNLVIEVKGQRDEKDKAKAETMRNLWVPAVNNAKRFGRWGFLELKDAPYDAAALIRELIHPLLAAEWNNRSLMVLPSNPRRTRRAHPLSRSGEVARSAG